MPGGVVVIDPLGRTPGGVKKDGGNDPDYLENTLRKFTCHPKNGNNFNRKRILFQPAIFVTGFFPDA